MRMGEVAGDLKVAPRTFVDGPRRADVGDHIGSPLRRRQVSEKNKKGDHIGSPLRDRVRRGTYIPRSILRTRGGMSFDITSGASETSLISMPEGT
jgi:hypothetical protein